MSSLGYVLTVCVFRIIKDRTPFLELHCGFILTMQKLVITNKELISSNDGVGYIRKQHSKSEFAQL